MVLSIEKKAEIIVLYKNKVSRCQITREMDISDWSVRNIIKNYTNFNSLNRKNRHERQIKRMCITDRFQHAGKINSIIYETIGVQITTRSMQTVLNNLGLRARRPAKKPLLITRMNTKP